MRRRSLSGREKIREALLLSFCDPIPREYSRLRLLSEHQWSHALEWLDISGLALYFLDRVIDQKLQDIIPRRVLARLEQNLLDNTWRIAQMIAEASAIYTSFQNAGLSWATLKGFSLWPVSVPRLELRSQLDLDFLVAEECGPEARRILEARGYRLHAISGRSWEFKAGEMPRPSLKNLYKATPHRCAELHIEPASAERPLLARTERQRLHDVWFPVLPAEDLFMGQGLHLFKHLCSESSRAAHMLEFRRHVMARSRDAEFWARLRPVAEADPRAPLALGVATLWITHLMGDFAPAAFTDWTVDRVPDSVRLWIEVYARRITLANSSGTKLYLLLRRELTRAEACGGRAARR
ncbi:MAG: nucleotidyltransferase family protein, partial [Acidobacteriaceae bacterium]